MAYSREMQAIEALRLELARVAEAVANLDKALGAVRKRLAKLEPSKSKK